MERTFGLYKIEVEGNHCTIYREDRGPVEPTFYEIQYMKDMAFGGSTTAVEVFPAHRHLVDGEHQRHLWRVESDTVPNLHTGQGVCHGEEWETGKPNRDEVLARLYQENTMSDKPRPRWRDCPYCGERFYTGEEVCFATALEEIEALKAERDKLQDELDELQADRTWYRYR